ncbi:phosphotransferase family protein [Ktedonosporobacter rubrisoli]|uniref:Phosphotransferase family protein n=1 Tax=Ktedonosporobacter rubrisoli TaxID=2509675 RepID=A0A4P6K0T9_KTERU|nr:phosphotransferase family protein [Ktedonosporobacter rubrisoli]QBD81664.1 phosphotransferase family protein [Ktedonosporobacter rubrisoli]
MSTDGETIAVRSGESFDIQRVEGYLHEHIAGLGEGLLQVRQFPSGASNLTYLLTSGDWQGVLRRPPFGPVAPKAHDMAREASLLLKIHPVFPLAPRPYIFCADLTIMGVPFYVMERREGIVLDSSFPQGVAVDDELCCRISEAVVETLVKIHAIDWPAAGLGSFGHPEGFLARQVKGWIERYRRASSDHIPQLEPLIGWLTEHIPLSPPPTLIHNDFKLNNMLMSRADLGLPVAVLDWEMATIGDPLFDLASSLSYWVEPDDPQELQEVLPTITARPGFITRERFSELYARKSGRDLSALHFYMIFAYFKLAVILQQIYVRWKRGQTSDERFATFDRRVRNLIIHAAHLAESGRR